MKLRKYCFYFLCLLLLASCDQTDKQTSGLEKSKSLNVYVKNLENNSIEKIKNAIEKDTVFLNHLIKLSSFELKRTFLMSSSNENNLSETVDEFKFKEERILKIDSVFNDYFKDISFEQSFVNDYKIEVTCTDDKLYEIYDKENIQFVENNIHLNKSQYYFQGKSILKKDSKLKRIDSVLVTATLKLPVDITPTQLSKKSTIKDGIKIDEINKAYIHVIVPTNRYKDFIKIQALNLKGERMDAVTYNANPILTIKPEIIESLNELKLTYETILKENNDIKIAQLINKITKNQIENCHQIVALDKEFKKIAAVNDSQKNNSFFFDLIEEQQHLFTSENVYLSAKFPTDIDNITLFFTTKYKEYLKNKMVYYGHDAFFNKNTPYIPYGIETDSVKEIGIINKNGDFIIPQINLAHNQSYSQRGNKYFFITTMDEETENYKQDLLWLDTVNKKLVPLPAFKDYIINIKPNYGVFEKDDKQGVAKNNKEIILPFEYDSFEVYDTFFIAYKRKEGICEIYDLNFNRLHSDIEIKSVKPLNGKHFFAKSNKQTTRFSIRLIEKDGYFGNCALMNEKTTILTPFKWNGIYEIEDFDFYFGIRENIKGTLYQGLVDKNGKTIVPPIFGRIDYNKGPEGLLFYKFKTFDEPVYIKLKDFIKKFKK